MSTQYTTEPPPTATVLLHTSAGPLTISLFAQQTPLTTRNFLQHCLDGTYNGTIFHRVAPGFVIQTGDPTGTGEGGTNIYEDGDKSLERYDETWARMLRLPEERYGERIVLGNEAHSRLKFNRRGLIGLARMSDEKGNAQGQYGSQWFITLGDCRAELDGKCTMFGRIEGDGIYNVMRIAGGEVVEGAERPVYPEKILNVEILEMPQGEAWRAIRKRERVAQRTTTEEKSKKKEKPSKKKSGKTLLSFGGDAGDEEEGAGVVVRPKKAKFNTALIDAAAEEEQAQANGITNHKEPSATNSKKRKSPESAPTRKSPEPELKRSKPSFHESTTQLPLKDPESPSRSPTPDIPRQRRASNHKSATALEAEIAALKASMKRDTAPTAEPKKKLSALEALIPATSTRGRKRPRPGETGSEDSASMKMLNAFKARLESADQGKETSKDSAATNGNKPHAEDRIPDAPDEEATLCDLHFIANCQSCSDWAGDNKEAEDVDDEGGKGFLSHSLTFEKDRLGKDLTWKQKNEEELVVIDPREREKELGSKKKHGDRNGDGKSRNWDRNRDRDRDRRKDERLRSIG
ncbi:Peptidyl-prolyl isomerase cwc27 [Lithohypha guttulata]|uniref:Peptidyl-prolyl isomerase cwc27 n=1 Tax=Lithohypha guttulata TaxID=1690604 RepID=UPI002DDF3E32|nr:Peptidyl-prolyl isomerase cwc27 [Lithohypha guttulata]KAK5106846.1 Peptidyl-prolyl isomerase cwc27 [Lithohypha guttulata]